MSIADVETIAKRIVSVSLQQTDFISMIDINQEILLCKVFETKKTVLNILKKKNAIFNLSTRKSTAINKIPPDQTGWFFFLIYLTLIEMLWWMWKRAEYHTGGCFVFLIHEWGFPGSSVVRNLSANLGDMVWPLGLDHLLNEEMATHSSILAKIIPWRDEPIRLKYMGSQRVGHAWDTSQFSVCGT